MPALAACAAVVVVAGIVLALTRDGTSTQPNLPADAGVPADWRTVSYPVWDIALQAPPEWRSYQYPLSYRFFDLIGYLSSTTLHDPCERTATSTRCRQPIQQLGPDDVLVGWSSGAPPQFPGISGLSGGKRTVLDGRAAIVSISDADESCAELGGQTSIGASVGGSSDPDSRIAYRMQACIGSDVDRSKVLTMLRTVQFAVHPESAHIVGRLLAVGGPAPGAPRPQPGTVTLRNRDTEITVLAGENGRYSAEVSPGTYEIEGHSPYYGGGKYVCEATGSVRVLANETGSADVYCQEP
jgi:hypothetical protein